MACSNGCFNRYREFNPGTPDDLCGAEAPVAVSGVVYFAGGLNMVADVIAIASRTRKMAVGSSSISTVAGAALSVARTEAGGMGNVDKGFICGGGTALSGSSSTALASRPVSTRSAVTDRLTYSTDVTAAVPGANLSSARNEPAGVGESTKGFMMGGETSAGVFSAIANKIDYAAETSSVVAGAALTTARKELAAIGDTTKGLLCGGNTGGRIIDKLVYSTEVTTLVSSTGLPFSRSETAFFGDTTKGYLAGGGGLGGSLLVTKVTYATETAASNANMLLKHFSGEGGGNGSRGVIPSAGMSDLDMSTDTWRSLSVVFDTVHHQNAAVSTGIFTV